MNRQSDRRCEWTWYGLLLNTYPIFKLYPDGSSWFRRRNVANMFFCMN